MPWHITPDHAECGEGKYAVVKDGSGEVEACHATEAEAKKHMAALYANAEDTHRAKDTKKPYGDVSYADPGYQSDGKKRYPLDSEEHCRAAWSYINMPKNAAKYTAEQVAAIKARIRSAAKKFGIDINEKSRPGLGLCVRSFGFEFETRDGGDGRTLEGYAAVFNSPATIRDLQGDFEETILPGAFKRSLAERTPILQWDHGKDPRVGTVPIGAIDALAEDSKGLHVRARLFDNQVVEPVRQAIEGKAIRGMSFRFGVPDGGEEWPSRDKRNIRDADVHELGPVAFPAYDTTSVSVRSLLAQLDPAEHRTLIRELAAELRLAVDLSGLTEETDEDLTGDSDAGSVERGDLESLDPGSGDGSAPSIETRRLEAEALRALGVLK